MNDSPEENDEPELDPEIEALLQFEPAPRKLRKANGWTPALQRRFIAKLAQLGSSAKAAEALGRDRYGVEKLYKTEGADSFRAAWDRALEIAEERIAAHREAERAQWIGVRPPGAVERRPECPAPPNRRGQALNERGEWEDEGALHRRADEARDAISGKLLQARRLYLKEISDSPGKRAAFEILTELPIDWDKAERLEPQPDEPWRRPNMREGDMLLTAENGWLGDVAHGPDKKAELRRMLDEHRAEQGLPPVEWDDE